MAETGTGDYVYSQQEERENDKSRDKWNKVSRQLGTSASISNAPLHHCYTPGIVHLHRIQCLRPRYNLKPSVTFSNQSSLTSEIRHRLFYRRGADSQIC